MRQPSHPERKIQTNIRLTPAARRTLAALADRWGISHADVIEISLRVLDDVVDEVMERSGGVFVKRKAARHLPLR